ncbi:hypothetical protein L211DRAFT_81402 [Terfezia boudieri ATCC MYA-4762]|uniref:Uncharacterized protein n=1 Tax=Terfezia boudieri ATCC MYA-4762 TaxID=1051890 RepID=A0A3N4LXP3_9PEZI|nr:hypothetical protein L211DRAFT_81402 [Terfezia boudieri ATCC MYA-4762]
MESLGRSPALLIGRLNEPDGDIDIHIHTVYSTYVHTYIIPTYLVIYSVPQAKQTQDGILQNMLQIFTTELLIACILPQGMRCRNPHKYILCSCMAMLRTLCLGTNQAAIAAWLILVGLIEFETPTLNNPTAKDLPLL